MLHAASSARLGQEKRPQTSDKASLRAGISTASFSSTEPRMRGCVWREDTRVDQPGTGTQTKVEGFGHMWTVAGSMEWVVTSLGGRKAHEK